MRIDEHLDSINSRQVWLGVQHVTNYRPSHQAAEGDISLVEKLNHFFAHFVVEPPTAAVLHAATHININSKMEEREVRWSQ